MRGACSAEEALPACLSSSLGPRRRWSARPPPPALGAWFEPRVFRRTLGCRGAPPPGRRARAAAPQSNGRARSRRAARARAAGWRACGSGGSHARSAAPRRAGCSSRASGAAWRAARPTAWGRASRAGRPAPARRRDPAARAPPAACPGRSSATGGTGRALAPARCTHRRHESGWCTPGAARAGASARAPGCGASWARPENDGPCRRPQTPGCWSPAQHAALVVEEDQPTVACGAAGSPAGRTPSSRARTAACCPSRESRQRCWRCTGRSRRSFAAVSSLAASQATIVRPPEAEARETPAAPLPGCGRGRAWRIKGTSPPRPGRAGPKKFAKVRHHGAFLGRISGGATRKTPAHAIE